MVIWIVMMMCNCGVFVVVIGIVVGMFGAWGCRRVIRSGCCGCGCVVCGDGIVIIAAAAARVNCVWVLDVVSWHWRRIACAAMLQLVADGGISSASC